MWQIIEEKILLCQCNLYCCGKSLLFLTEKIGARCESPSLISYFKCWQFGGFGGSRQFSGYGGSRLELKLCLLKFQFQTHLVQFKQRSNSWCTICWQHFCERIYFLIRADFCWTYLFWAYCAAAGLSLQKRKCELRSWVCREKNKLSKKSSKKALEKTL